MAQTVLSPRMLQSIVRLVSVLIPAVALATSSDLTPTIYDVHFETNATVDQSEVTDGCAGGTTGRTLLRFGTRVTNLGPDTLLIGDPGCPDCTNPANNGVSCQDPRFVCDAAIWGGVPHFRSAALFELLDPSGDDVVVGSKRGYCFNDDECMAGVSPQFTSCGYQGLTVGCTDDYQSYLYCQYVDLTDVPNATTRAFTLRVTIDTLDLLPDPNRANNIAEMAIPGCGDGMLQPGEACDDGAVNGTPASCCTAACQFAAAGTACSGGVCDGRDRCGPTPPTTTTTSTPTTTSTTRPPTTTTTTTTQAATTTTTTTSSTITTSTTTSTTSSSTTNTTYIPTTTTSTTTTTTTTTIRTTTTSTSTTVTTRPPTTSSTTTTSSSTSSTSTTTLRPKACRRECRQKVKACEDACGGTGRTHRQCVKECKQRGKHCGESTGCQLPPG